MTERAYYCPYCETGLTRIEAFGHEHDQYRGLDLWPLHQRYTPPQEQLP